MSEIHDSNLMLHIHHFCWMWLNFWLGNCFDNKSRESHHTIPHGMCVPFVNGGQVCHVIWRLCTDTCDSVADTLLSDGNWKTRKTNRIPSTTIHRILSLFDPRYAPRVRTWAEMNLSSARQQHLAARAQQHAQVILAHKPKTSLKIHIFSVRRFTLCTFS